MHKGTFVLATLCVMAASHATLFTFKASLSGDQETPPVSTQATGNATLTVDTGSPIWLFSIDMTADHLQGSPVVSHLHVAPVGTPGPVAIDLGAPTVTGGSAGDWSAKWHTGWGLGQNFEINGLTREHILTLLQDGLVYANVHTGVYPDGEVRGQLGAVPEPATLAVLGVGLLGVIRRKQRR